MGETSNRVGTRSASGVMPRAMVREWYPITDAEARAIALVPGLRYEHGAWRVHRTHLALLQRKIDPPAYDPLELPYTPKDWQPEATAFLATRRGVLLTDEMRVGKTVETLSSWDPAKETLCIIAPLAAHPNWLAWIERRAPGIEVSVLEGRTFDRDELRAPVVLLHYEILGAWHALDYRPHLLVFDEMHLLSNSGALRTQVAMSLSTQAARVVGLTGSPLWNHPAGLHAILSCLSPGAWGSQSDFILRYAGGERGKYGIKAARPTNMDEFHVRCAEVVFGRTWAEIGIDPGHIVRTVEEVPVAWEDERNIDLQLAEVMAKTTKGGRLAAMTKARKLLGDLKMRRALELALEFDGPLVVWCWHVGIAKVLATLAHAAGRSTFVVTGKETPRQRRDLLDSWRAHKNAILVATISVAQVGIDLSHAAKCVFAELDFTPANIAQAEMRTFSPDRPMEVVYVATTHNADMAVVGALCRKQADGDALGLRAAEGAVAVLGELFGVTDKPNLERLFADIVAEPRIDL